MNQDFEQIKQSKLMLEKIAKGVNPLTNVQIEKSSFVNDAKVNQCFNHVIKVLDNVMNGAYSNNKLTEFIITPEQKTKVKLPQGKIGVNEFSRCINSCIDPSISKKLTGVELNKKLKKLGILSEKPTEKGKTRTITNEKSSQYGFSTERKLFNGEEYDMVLVDEKGKKYLLDNIESIMSA